MSRRVVILAAHGSRHDARVNAQVEGWARELVARGFAEEAIAAFHQGTPTFAEAIDAVSGGHVVVVPVMTSEGYYCETFLPGELAKNRRRAEVSLSITRPVGVAEGMARLVAARIDELAQRNGVVVEDASIAIVGHGTKRHERSRRATEGMVERLREGRGLGKVAAFFLDESPTVEQIPEVLTGQVILVEPFFIGGAHAEVDIPGRLERCAGGRRIIVDSAVGNDSRMIEVIEALARDGLASRLLRLGTRGSRLARWQAERVAELLRGLGQRVELVEISTVGDREVGCAISDFATDTPFVEDIEAALMSGAIDLAVHSLKDMAIGGPAGLCVAAVLARGSVTESLVSREGRRLAELRAGAVIGTSSPRRAAQVRRLRPDLVVRPIRGAVEDRVRQVRAGKFDAAILATAGLERLGLEQEACEEFSMEEILPAPGQGAIAIQTRTDDEELREIIGALNDAATRRAVTAELEFLRPFERDREQLAAAYCRTEGNSLELRYRVSTADGEIVGEGIARGREPGEVARAALEAVGVSDAAGARA